MQIENRKYYMTRDGQKVGPMNVPPAKPFWNKHVVADCSVDGSYEGWYGGGVFAENANPMDLVAECEPDANLTAIDHLRKAAELFVLAGQDQAAIDVLGLVIYYEVTK